MVCIQRWEGEGSHETNLLHIVQTKPQGSIFPAPYSLALFLSHGRPQLNLLRPDGDRR